MKQKYLRVHLFGYNTFENKCVDGDQKIEGIGVFIDEDKFVEVGILLENGDIPFLNLTHEVAVSLRDKLTELLK